MELIFLNWELKDESIKFLNNYEWNQIANPTVSSHFLKLSLWLTLQHFNALF